MRLGFTKDENGAWRADGVEFSLSHSEGMLAVAISHAPVGIDIERIRPLHDAALANKLLTETEHTIFKRLPAPRQNEYLITCFSGKEAVFKKEKGGLRLSEIDTTTAKVTTQVLSVDGETFALAIATDTPNCVRVFDNINLTN